MLYEQKISRKFNKRIIPFYKILDERHCTLTTTVSKTSITGHHAGIFNDFTKIFKTFRKTSWYFDIPFELDHLLLNFLQVGDEAFILLLGIELHWLFCFYSFVCASQHKKTKHI